MRTLRPLVIGACALVLALTASLPSTAAAASTPGWKVAKRLPPGSTLDRVSALSGIAWAIGHGPYQEGTGLRAPLIMRFDGSRWSEVPAPGVAELTAIHPDLEYLEDVEVTLGGVFARTASDAWIVGSVSASDPDADRDLADVQFPVTMHWDGTAWRLVPSPGPRRQSWLRDVVAFGPDDVWAVGGSIREGDMQPLALHWDGSHWSIDTGVKPGMDLGGDLYAASRTPWSETLWTVGHGWDVATETINRPLVERYRGGSWTHSPVPGYFLRDVAAIAWDDIWAVGSDGHGPIALHRGRTSWSVVPTPAAPAGGFHGLSSVSAVSSSNVWAVGHAGSPGGLGQALIEHWNGTSWSVVPAPLGVEQGLIDIAMRTSGYGWAVGNGGGTGTGRPVSGVILRHYPG